MRRISSVGTVCCKRAAARSATTAIRPGPTAAPVFARRIPTGIAAKTPTAVLPASTPSCAATGSASRARAATTATRSRPTAARRRACRTRRYICPTPGMPCTRLYACGDGRLNGSDQCDDGDNPPAGGDGCSATCTIEAGWLCRRPGEACVLDEYCGDGVRRSGEAATTGTRPGVTVARACARWTPSRFAPRTAGSLDLQVHHRVRRRRAGIPARAATTATPANGDGCCVDLRAATRVTSARPSGSSARDSSLRRQPRERQRVVRRRTTRRRRRRLQRDLPARKRLHVRASGSGLHAHHDVRRRRASRRGEQCDDGNTTGGDGCSRQCRIEADWACTGSRRAQHVHLHVRCGDGIVGGSEVCDDGNTAERRRLLGELQPIETGCACTRDRASPAGPMCGDGIGAAATSSATTATPTNGDGCNARCRIEDNTVCTGGPDTADRAARPTTCGDGTGQQGTEPCDDGNNDWGDGCTPACTKEPVCAVGAACTSACGDGIKFPSEACDDGNTTSGDGCSATCTDRAGLQLHDGGRAPRPTCACRWWCATSSPARPSR